MHPCTVQMQSVTPPNKASLISGQFVQSWGCSAKVVSTRTIVLASGFPSLPCERLCVIQLIGPVGPSSARLRGLTTLIPTLSRGGCWAAGKLGNTALGVGKHPLRCGESWSWFRGPRTCDEAGAVGFSDS